MKRLRIFIVAFLVLSIAVIGGCQLFKGKDESDPGPTPRRPESGFINGDRGY